MADNIQITPGEGQSVAADEVNDPVLGTVAVGYGKIMDGTDGGTAKLTVTDSGAALTQPINSTGTRINPSTEDTLTELKDFLLSIQPLAHISPFARDFNDRLYVSSTGSAQVTYIGLWNNGTYTTLYGIGAPNAVDTREPLTEQTQLNFITIRNRWTFS